MSQCNFLRIYIFKKMKEKGLPSSGILQCRVDFSGQPTGLNFQGQEVQEEHFLLRLSS
jgi:uncharacterized protein YwqG